MYEIWAGDFDYLYDRIGEGVYTLTKHPQSIGRGHRLLMLERLIRHIQSHRGVEFKTMLEVATAWKKSHPLTDDQPNGQRRPRRRSASRPARSVVLSYSYPPTSHIT